MSTRKLFNAVDKAPFAGKFLIRDSTVKYFRSTPEKESRQFLKTSLLLGIMVVAHAYQAKLGVDTAISHVESLSRDGGEHEAILSTYDMAYAGAMSAVTARQAALLGRVGKTHMKRRRKNKETQTEDSGDKKEATQSSKKGRTAAMLGAVAFTLTAQVGMMYSSYDVLDKENTVACEKFIDNYAQEHPELGLDLAEASEWKARAC